MNDEKAQKADRNKPAKTRTELYFEQLFRAHEDLAEYQWQLKKARMRPYGLVSPSGMMNTRVKVSLCPDAAFTRKLDKMEELLQRLSSRIQLLQALISQAAGLVEQYTSGREKKILALRYLERYEWLSVSKEVDNLSVKQLRRIARKGLAKIILPDDAIWIHDCGIAA